MRIHLAVLLLALASSPAWSAEATGHSTWWTVHFSPKGGCTALGRAKSTVLMDVEPEGEPLLLPPEEAAKWKPHYGAWMELMEREFGAESGD